MAEVCAGAVFILFVGFDDAFGAVMIPDVGADTLPLFAGAAGTGADCLPGILLLYPLSNNTRRIIPGARTESGFTITDGLLDGPFME